MSGFLSSNYNFLEIEKKWREFWEKNQTYKWNDKIDRKDSFVVDTPPPTVSGQLHIGHIFSYTQADFITRFQRMKGKNVFYPIGFDDNGLPTERLVEKRKKVRAYQLHREEFIKLCMEVVNQEEEKFKALFDKIGLSVDWSLVYQTISPLSQKISQMSFLDLVNKNQVYRSEQPVLWDPVDQTALSQADIEDKEKISKMNYIKFYTEAGEEFEIATTRPELLPACCAVFFNPEDEKYTKFKNQYAITPLFNVKVPILPESTVNVTKGTGLVMCCTFGDSNDVLWWNKHSLPTKIIINKYGKLRAIDFELDCKNRALFDKYYSSLEGQKIEAAREIVLNLLAEENLLTKQESITQTVKCAERSGAALEILTSNQWFVKILDHKKELLELSQKLRWHPKSMKIKLDNWINNISWDWCISRQRFFGVPFPVWYSKRTGEEGKPIFADISQLPVNPLQDLPLGYNRDEVVADSDVMDTWSTSSVSPQLSSHAISEELAVNFSRHQSTFPADLRPQAHEIIRTWTFYTLVKSYLHQSVLPWSNIMISGWCLSHDNTKMSKSKDNVINPESLIIKYGSDVVRYWASTSRLGADTAFSENVLLIGKKLVHKLWNATKFCLHNIAEKIDSDFKNVKECVDNHIIVCTTDLWILSKLHQTIKQVSDSLENYEYALSRSCIEEFFLKDFCDNYIELIKARIYDDKQLDPAGQKSAIYTLFFCLKNILIVFAPYLPFVTEELLHSVYLSNKLEYTSIHSSFMWPKLDDFIYDDRSAKKGDEVIAILELVRKSKTNRQLSIKTPISLLQIISEIDLRDCEPDLKAVTSSQRIEFGDNPIDLDKDTLSSGNLTINIFY